MRHPIDKINLDLIRAKLKYLESYLIDLKEITPSGLEEYLGDRRNALVHDYNNVDEEQTFSRISPFMELFQTYFEAVKSFANEVEAQRRNSGAK